MNVKSVRLRRLQEIRLRAWNVKQEGMIAVAHAWNPLSTCEREAIIS